MGLLRRPTVTAWAVINEFDATSTNGWPRTRTRVMSRVAWHLHARFSLALA